MNAKQEIGIVILSRYNSSRLPGKALMKLVGKPVLTYIVERLSRVVPLDHIVLATSSEKSDDPIADFAKAEGISCFRGSLDNVSERFFQAAYSKGWDYAARINGDNIFVDINVLSDMLALARDDKYDFISNVKGRTFPKGMSIEIVRVAYYQGVLPHINETAAYREHVTLYLYEQALQDTHYYYLNHALPKASGIQLALDTREDFERSESIIREFKKEQWTYNMEEIMNILKHINHG